MTASTPHSAHTRRDGRWRPVLRALVLCIAAACLCGGQPPGIARADIAGNKVYLIDPASTTIAFSVEEWGGLRVTEGRFAAFSGLIALDRSPAQAGAGPPAGRVELEIEAASVRVAGTEDERLWREHELRGADFFDAERHPRIRFVSHRLERTGGRQARLHGTLTIRGIARPASFALTFWAEQDGGAQRLRFDAKGVIDRSGYGMTAWQDVLGRQVELSISGSADPGAPSRPGPDLPMPSPGLL